MAERARVMAKERESDVIFCGNPGVGKSTLLSSVSNLHFESGLSWGEGLTSELKWQESPDLPGFRFGDTPGLADIAMAEKASVAITSALNSAAKLGRSVKIFFVVTAEAGRIRPDDLFTIKLVMGSIKLSDGREPGPNAYGLILNKALFLDRPDFPSKGQVILQNAVGLRSETVPFPTTYVRFLPNLESMAVASNRKQHFDGLTDFVLGFPGMETIKSASVIDVSSLEEKLKAAKETHKADMDAVEEKLKQGNREELSALQRQLDSTRLDMKQKLADADRQADRSSSKGTRIVAALKRCWAACWAALKRYCCCCLF